MPGTTDNRFGIQDAYTDEWLGRSHPVQQKRWAPLLRSMTADQLQEFHVYRLKRAAGFFSPEDTPPGRNERDEAERLLLAHWTARLKP